MYLRSALPMFYFIIIVTSSVQLYNGCQNLFRFKSCFQSYVRLL